MLIKFRYCNQTQPLTIKPDLMRSAKFWKTFWSYFRIWKLFIHVIDVSAVETFLGVRNQHYYIVVTTSSHFFLNLTFIHNFHVIEKILTFLRIDVQCSLHCDVHGQPLGFSPKFEGRLLLARSGGNGQKSVRSFS
jgi:hypothetical protein